MYEAILSFVELEFNLNAHSIKVNLIVDNVYSLFQLEEIIFALKDRLVGVNAGRWGFLASLQLRSKFEKRRLFLEERNDVLIDDDFLVGFNRYIIHIAHKRGLHCMGGASAFTPARGSQE